MNSNRAGGRLLSPRTLTSVVNAALCRDVLVTEVCRTLLAVVEGCGLSDCWQWKPLLDGKATQVQYSRGGPCVGVHGVVGS
jgi:hypothetical protein